MGGLYFCYLWESHPRILVPSFVWRRLRCLYTCLAPFSCHRDAGQVPAGKRSSFSKWLMSDGDSSGTPDSIHLYHVIAGPRGKGSRNLNGGGLELTTAHTCELLYSFAFHGFGHPWLTMTRTCQMENSRKKCFELHTVLASTRKYCAIQLCHAESEQKSPCLMYLPPMPPAYEWLIPSWYQCWCSSNP